MSLYAAALPVVRADSNENASAEKRIRVSSVSLYEEPEKKEYFVNPPSQLEGYVKDARNFLTDLKRQYQPAIDKTVHVYETGVAHTKEALVTLRQEDNLIDRIGFMTVGGVLGLLAARRGRFLRKVTYTAIGVSATGAVCYPAESKVLAKEAALQARKNALIAYHFIIGARPEVANQNGQAFDKVANMVSDVWQWGFRLFNGNQTETVEIPKPVEEDKIVVVEEKAVEPEQQQQQQPEAATLVKEEEPVVVVVEGDLGQANVEDNELYTTRG